MIRVGVYPQDGGLSAGMLPTTAPGLKNVQNGAQHGSNFVQQQLDGLMHTFDDALSTSVHSFHFDGAVHFPAVVAGRKSIHKVQCGDEYTAVTLSNGENRFLGDILGAIRRVQSLTPKTVPRRAQMKREVALEAPCVSKTVTSLHLGILGTTIEKVYSKPNEKEHLLVRARRGTQKPRALIRITFSQLQRLAFPYHTP